MSNKLRNFIALILFVVGVGLLLVTPIKQYLVKEKIEQATTELQTLTPEKVQEAEQVEATYDYDVIEAVSLESILAAKKSEAKLPMIGEIAVPDVGINLPVVKGVTNENMLVGAATLTPNQKMGTGNYSLASHYSDAYNETLLFSPLIKSKPGMKIYLTDLTNVYIYEITSVTLVDPTAVHVLNETGENIITLVTCNDISATQRRIVRGKLVDTIKVSDAPESIHQVFQVATKTY